ncbi:MAG TPA: bifunctional 5,10-methylenetetrahydrofolate dehydrogenase/5,10-methenyltetrahydrofolate cyclohydrolase [Actinomycetota bacterium]|nr:bifunctional 5,10-methylenetetrahydrofolate dehydrogenase/5,10-methenyltetrahydrofolate cyclohydrolase [Actinomycetota bacterium]
MTAIRIDGKQVSAEVKEQVRLGVEELKAATGITPGLAAILVGDDPASQVYVGSKEKAAVAAGMNGWVHRLPATASQAEVADTIRRMNEDPAVHGILLQLPLPKGLDAISAVELIDYRKDSDGLTSASAGLLSQGNPRFVPCTALGVQVLLAHTGAQVKGANVVVVGRSNLVGRPLSILLSLKNGPPNPLNPAEKLPADGTVTLCHTGTADLAAHTREADILVVAAGVTKYITGDMIKPGATVIDVGMNRDENNKLCGDVDYASAVEVAGAITPVPGGVGPMTVAMLMSNTLAAAKLLGA